MTADVPPTFVLFDLDGTLADTFADLFWALERALDEGGYPPPQRAPVREQVSAGAGAMTRAGFAGANGDAERVCQRFLDLYRDNLAVRTRLFEGTQVVLDALARADVGYGIVTNKRSALTEPLLDMLGLEPAPRCVVSGDTTSRAKPHPDPLLHAAELVATEASRCVYVGDARNDVLAARAAGMPVAAAAWGYIPDGDDPAEWQPDVILRTPPDLLDWLRLPD